MEEIKKKVVLLGDSAVGKTSMIRRFVEDRYDDNYISTVGAKVSKKTIYVVPEKETIALTMMIWDVIGSQGYTATQSIHIAGADCALLVHDLTRPETLDSLMSYWIPLLNDVTSGVLPPLMIAGNKSDLMKKEDIMRQEDIYKAVLTSRDSGPLIRRVYPLPMSWLPTSAKTGDNIEECFYMMGLMMAFPKSAQDSFLFSVVKDLEGIIAEDMLKVDTPTTILELSDYIMAECIRVMGPDLGSEMLRSCFHKTGFNKDQPDGEGLRRVIMCLTSALADSGMDRALVNRLKDRWLQLLKDILTQ